MKMMVGVAILAVAALAAVAHSVSTDRRALDVPADEARLYGFARSADPPDALFIVPPGLDRFRFFAERAVYVDWRMFPTPLPPLLPVWFARLKEVARPDAAALAGQGWPSVPLWDASYGRSNPPRRVAELLALADADYFVWDRLMGGAVTSSSDAVAQAGVEIAFQNSRFVVYKAAGQEPDRDN
jgi:hypothetical protein